MRGQVGTAQLERRGGPVHHVAFCDANRLIGPSGRHVRTLGRRTLRIDRRARPYRRLQGTSTSPSSVIAMVPVTTASRPRRAPTHHAWPPSAAAPGKAPPSHAAIVVRSALVDARHTGGALPSSTTQQADQVRVEPCQQQGGASPHPPIFRLDSGPPRRDPDRSVP